MSCIVTQLAHESFGICHFCERIRLNLINPRVLKLERGLYMKMLDSFTVRPWKNEMSLRRHFEKPPPFWKYATKLCNHSMLPLIISCTTLRNFGWHLLWHNDNREQKYCQTLGNKPNHSHCVLRGQLFSKGKI